MAVRPPVTTNKVFQVGTESEYAGAYIRQIDTDFEMLKGPQYKLVELFGTSEAVYLSEDYEHEWIRDEAMPGTVDLAAGFTAASDTTLTLEDAYLVQVGQVLAVGDQQFRVTGHDSATVVDVTKSYAGSTAANLSSGTTLYILPPDALDVEGFNESVKGRGEIVYNTPGQFQKKWSQSDMYSSMRTYLTKNQDEMDYETPQQQRRIKMELNNMIIFGRRVKPTASVRGQFGGLRQLITTNKVAVNGAFTPSVLADTFEAMRLIDDASRGKTIIGNMSMKRVWNAVFEEKFDRVGEPNTNSVGMKVDTIHTEWGTYDFMLEDSIPNGELFIVNPDDIKLVPIHTQHGSGWLEYTWGPEVNEARYKARGVSNILTFEIKNEKRHAHFTGIDTSPALYSAYV